MQQMARIGREGFQNLSSEAKLMNAILGEDSVQAAERFNQQIARTGTIFEAWKLSVGEFVLPKINSMLEALNKLVTGRDLPAIGALGNAAGNKSLLLPPDPAVARRMFDEEAKLQADAMNRGKDLFNAISDNEVATLKKNMAGRIQTHQDIMALMREEHQAKMHALLKEEQVIKKMMEIEKTRFEKDLSTGGLSDDDRTLRAKQHDGIMKELKDRLGIAQVKTGTQGLLFDADELNAERDHAEDLMSWLRGELQGTYEFGDRLRHEEQDDTIKHYKSLIKFQETFGTSREHEIQAQYDLVKANLAKELDVNYETAEKVLQAWAQSDHARAEMLLEGTTKTTQQLENIWMDYSARYREVSLQNSDDFFEGFARSMKRYVDDKSMLGLGVDQARRVAQGMEQALGQFFFDAMEGRIQSFKDIVENLTDFAKKIVSDLAGALLTRSILTALTAGAGGGGGASPVSFLPGHRNGGIAAFASGGIAHRPMLRWAGGGMNLIGEGSNSEAYVPLPDGNRIPVTMDWKGPYPATQPAIQKIDIPPVHVTVNNHGQDNVEVSQRTGVNGMQEIDILITQKLNQAITKGHVDTALRQRFDQRPSLVRR